MDGGDEDMEIDVITQHDDELIRMENDQFMEDESEHDFKHVTNQEPLLIQETSTPTEQVNNPLPMGTRSISLI